MILLKLNAKDPPSTHTHTLTSFSALPLTNQHQSFSIHHPLLIISPGSAHHVVRLHPSSQDSLRVSVGSNELRSRERGSLPAVGTADPHSLQTVPALHSFHHRFAPRSSSPAAVWPEPIPSHLAILPRFTGPVSNPTPFWWRLCFHLKWPVRAQTCRPLVCLAEKLGLWCVNGDVAACEGSLWGPL